MSLFELLRPDLRRDSPVASLPPDVQTPQAHHGPWMLDPRSLGIGIAIGIVITVIFASFIGLLSVTFRRPTQQTHSHLRSRTTLPLTFSIPNKLPTTSKNRHAPIPAQRLSLESHIVLAPARSPSPEFVLDIAPRKGKAPSSSSPSTPFTSHPSPELDIKEMRSMNTFSGLPTTSNTTHRRPTSSPGMEFPQDPSSSSSRQRHPHHSLSGQEQDAGINSAPASVRRVQSTGYFDRDADRKLARELEWERRRGMGHTLPRPEPAKTVSSRPGTSDTSTGVLTGTGTGTSSGVGTWTTTENRSSTTLAPFSSASSLAVHLQPSSGAVSPTLPGSASGSGGLVTVHGAEAGASGVSQSAEKTHRRHRNKRDKSSKSSHSKQPSAQIVVEPSHPLELTPLPPVHQHVPQHTHSHPMSVGIGLGLEDIAPPPYNVANVHTFRSHDRAGSSASISTSGLEMGFGASHHARNHLL